MHAVEGNISLSLDFNFTGIKLQQVLLVTSHGNLTTHMLNMHIKNVLVLV